VLLNLVIRAFRDLLQLGLFQLVGVTEKRQWKLYRLTRMGRRVLNQLQVWPTYRQGNDQHT